MAENESSGRFEELRQRWEQEPSSRIFTQLAEEYRRRGEPMEAVRVLEEGLRHHPASVAAQVSLGRCRLEAGLLEPALAALEAVVRKDPTQMVAYRLLVEAYLQLGDAPAAQERLEIYSQLNPQDPEIETLEERIRQLEGAVGPSPPLAAAVEQEDDLSWLTDPPPGEASERAAAPPPLPAPALAPRAAAAPRPPAAVPEPDSGEPTTVEVTRSGTAAAATSAGPSLLSLSPSPHPVPNLFALVPRALRRWQEGATASMSAGAAAVAPPVGPVGSLQEEPAPDLDEVATSGPFVDEGLSDDVLTAEAPVEAPDAAGVRSAAPEIGEEEEIFDRFDIDHQLEEASSLESELLSLDDLDLTAEEELLAGSPPSAPPALPPVAEAGLSEPGGTAPRLDLQQKGRTGYGEATPEPTPPSLASPASTGAGPGPQSASEATVTLGELYRRQGHSRDAEQIFRRVLDADPDNAGARTGLDEITAQRRGPADIASLLGDAASPEAGVTERKAKVLRNYLELLSEGSRDDVP